MMISIEFALPYHAVAVAEWAQEKNMVLPVTIYGKADGEERETWIIAVDDEWHTEFVTNLKDVYQSIPEDERPAIRYVAIPVPIDHIVSDEMRQEWEKSFLRKARQNTLFTNMLPSGAS